MVKSAAAQLPPSPTISAQYFKKIRSFRFTTHSYPCTVTSSFSLKKKIIIQVSLHMHYADAVFFISIIMLHYFDTFFSKQDRFTFFGPSFLCSGSEPRIGILMSSSVRQRVESAVAGHSFDSTNVQKTFFAKLRDVTFKWQT